MKVCIFVAGFLVTLVRGQFLRDDNVDRFVPRSQVEDKIPACNALRFAVETQLVGGVAVLMVDRSKFMASFYGRSTALNCPEGTLFSLLPSLCVCSVIIPDHERFNQDRCVTVSGNFQESNVFTKVQRFGATSRTGVTYIDGSEDVPFSNSDNCQASNADQYFSIPFFHGNSISRSSFDLQIQFYITDRTIGDSVYNIFSNAPCQFETEDASFIVSYLRNAGTGTIVTGLALRDGWQLRGNTEVSVTYSCRINSFTSGARTFTFNENDPSNRVRVFGSLRNPRGIQLVVWNAELESVGLGSGGVPITGFCPSPSIDSASGLRRVLGQYIIGERNCDPFVGQAPSNGRMCVGEMSLTRDC